MKSGEKERFLFVAARPALAPWAAGSTSFSPFGSMTVLSYVQLGP